MNKFQFTVGAELVRGNLIDTIPTLQSAWRVSFAIKPTGTREGWSSILHFTKNSDHDETEYLEFGL